MKYTQTKEQREVVNTMFEAMTPSSTRSALIEKLNLRKPDTKSKAREPLKKGKLSIEERSAMTEMYDSGMSVEDIATKMRRGTQTVIKTIEGREKPVRETVLYEPREFVVSLGPCSVNVVLPVGMDVTQNSILLDEIERLLEENRV